MDVEQGDPGRPGRQGEIPEGVGWTEQGISMVLERNE